MVPCNFEKILSILIKGKDQYSSFFMSLVIGLCEATTILCSVYYANNFSLCASRFFPYSPLLLCNSLSNWPQMSLRSVLDICDALSFGPTSSIFSRLSSFMLSLLRSRFFLSLYLVILWATVTYYNFI